MGLFKSSSNLYCKFFANRFCYKWNRWMLQSSVKALGVNNGGDNTGEYYLLKRLITSRKAPVLFDVGASVGGWSEMALKINPQACIYAFEPGRKPFEILQKKLPSLKAFNVACSNEAGEGVLYDRKDQPNFSHASLDYDVIDRLNKGVDQHPVQIVTLDEIIRSAGVTKIDLLKIDVEGFEYEVLQGAKEALAQGVIENIQFEFNEMNVVRRRFVRDFYQLLPDFALFRLLPRSQIPLRRYDPILHEFFTYQNLLATRLP